MKILHTADWHLNKSVHEQNMLADQKYILDELIKIIQIEKPDVMIVAGDIYDRSNPTADAIELLDDVLCKIVLEHKVKVIAISGNHDNPIRVGFAGKILKDNGLYMVGELNENIQPIIIDDEYGQVSFYTIPYADHAYIREMYKDKNIKSPDDAMKAVVNKIYENMDESKRNVCVAHSYVASTYGLDKPVESDSERPLTVGGSEIVDAEYFNKFTYTALGHLHKGQKALNENIRYSGSILKYSFSESNHKKSVTIVNIDEQGNVELNHIPLIPKKDMRVIKGKLADLVSEKVYSLSNTKDYIKAILTDEGEILDAMYTLRSVYPNILKMERDVNAAGELNGTANTAQEYAKKNPIDIVKKFYENVSGSEFDDKKQGVIEEILEQIKRGERE